MTIVPASDYSDGMIKRYRYKFSKCPRCKAKTLVEAETKCRPYQDFTGEYSCPGDGESPLNPFELKWDLKGRACELTKKSTDIEAKALDAWCMEQMSKMEQMEGDQE